MRNFIAAISLVLIGIMPSLRQTQTPIPAQRGSAMARAGQESKKAADQALPVDRDDLGSEAMKIIVTMPDPKLTRLGMEFDRWIDSLQAAAAASGFEFESQWLPWAAGATKYTEPGRLWFRNKSNGHSLVLFLVGESPSSGISEQQFERALALGPQHLTGVIGPSFSGGFPSLQHLLGEHIRDTPVITGSATSNEAAERFCKGCFRLSRTVDTDAAAESRFYNYLQSRQAIPRRVADLEETDTAYGNETGHGAKQTQSTVLIVTHARFPRDISALRGAYESSQLLQKSLEQNAQNPQADASVQLSGADLQSGMDSVPIQSPVATAATEDLEMQELSRRLQDGRFSLATLRATNPLDIVFLRQYIAARDPDLQFYLLEPDILFIHQPEVHAFRGTLAVSRYPLFENPTRRIMIFPSKAAEGLYWAVRSMLGSPSNGQSSNLWLSMIGIDGYWPIARLARDGDTCIGTACPAKSEVADLAEWTIRPTRVYVALWLLDAAVLLFVTVAAVKGYRLPREATRIAPRKWFADFYFEPEAPLVFARSFQAFSLMLGLTAIFLLLSRPLAEAWSAWVYLPSLPAVAGLWACFPLPFRKAAVAPPYLISDEKITAFDGRMTRLLALVAALGVVVLLAFFFFGVWGMQENDWAVFAAYRSVHLGNGVNPTLPLFLVSLSLACCAWYHFQRFIFASERFVPLDLSGYGTLTGPYERLRDVLARYASGPAVIAASVAGALVVILTYLYQSALSIEGRSYDLSIVAMLTISAFFTMLSVCQFLQAWWHFSDFLNAVQELPVRHVFYQLPRELGSVALFSVSPRERSYIYLLRARDCLRSIEAIPEEMLSRVETSVKVMLERTGHDQRPTSFETADAQASLLAANSFLLSRLKTECWCKGESEMPDLKEKREAHVALAEEFIALRILSFLRYATLQLRNLLTYFSVGFILQAMAVSSYPFFSRSLSKMFILVTFGILSGAAGYVLLGMSRNITLRSLATDDKGRDHPIALQALQTASLPLLAFATSYFPDLGNALLGWVNSAVELGK